MNVLCFVGGCFLKVNVFTNRGTLFLKVMKCTHKRQSKKCRLFIWLSLEIEVSKSYKFKLSWKDICRIRIETELF